MNSLLASTHSLLEMFDGKLQEFASNVDSTHMVWLEEIQQEANRMFSSDFNAEPELMPKTPSQKKKSRRKRISVSHNENRGMQRFSKGKRSNLRTSSVQTLKPISENIDDLGARSLQEKTAEEKLPKRNTRQNNRQKQTAEMEPGEMETPRCSLRKPPQIPCLEQTEDGADHLQRDSLGQARAYLDAQNLEGMSQQEAPVAELTSFAPQPQSMLDTAPEKLVPVVRISAAERVSADIQENVSSHCRTASKLAISKPLETPAATHNPRRSSIHRSLTLRRSLAGLRHSMTQESVRRASRRSFLKKKARMSSSTCSSSASGVCVEMDEEKAEGMNNVLEHPAESETDLVEQRVGDNMTSETSDSEGIRRVTRSMAQTIPTPPHSTKKSSESSTSLELDDGGKKPVEMSSSLRSRPSVKRRAAEAAEEPSSPRKKLTPPKKSQSAIRPNMKSFLHTVQKNQLLMMTPGSLSRNTVVKSFIKHTTPLRVDLKPGGGLVERERLRLEAAKKKQEQEIERKKKLEEEKRKKQEEMKRKRDERLRKVVEARVKEEQREEEKKKKIEQKMAYIEEKNDKLRVERLAEEKAKKKVASKRQEELEQRKRQEEEARRRKILQAEEEKKQQELLMKRRAEEEQERARRLAEAHRALELKKEQERVREQEQQRELLRQQQAAAQREQVEREKALALQRELEKAAREKEQKEAEERKINEERQKQVEQERAAAVTAAARNVVTVEIQKSIMKTPVGKAGGLNLTMDIETSMKTPVGKATGLNVTMDVERSSPQSYEITPKGGNKPLPVSANPEDYGMDQNSDDSTDDESAPRKPIPSWAEGRQLQQAMLNQYFNPVDVDSYFGEIEEPKLEQIFNKSKPRYFKRTSSAVWQSPPRVGHTAY
ncbi:inner centromere protein A isoform X1 [Anguilla rostrata]|uniref:inner centromere protein A isoform X1 n=1 Tax=Anguilla rostrata TaxID=7938 RepID=UPI0030D4D05F